MFKSLIKQVVPADKLSYWKRRLLWTPRHWMLPQRSLHSFTCNICSRQSSFPRQEMMRETPSCVYCGSCVRFRSIIHTLSVELFGESLNIDEFPNRPELCGIGLSDWEGYAERLKGKLTYVNTYYHKEPQLDITALDPAVSDLYDFIIATEVFEHIAPPISRAFHNAYRLLKPGGVLIFSVPLVDAPTREHFPELYTFSLTNEGTAWVLKNKTRDGRSQRFDEITFHGGPGTTIEMRVFGRSSLVQEFKDAGFTAVRAHDEEVDRSGILWNPYDPEKAPYRPMIYGLDAPPYSARKVKTESASNTNLQVGDPGSVQAGSV